MDGRQFDDVVRALTQSRRSVLGGVLAGVAGMLGVTDLGAKKKHNKKRRCTAQNCAHGCCKTPHGPCGSGVVDSECGSGGKPCQVCRGTTHCLEPERGGCCQGPSGDCSATTSCCYEHAGLTACVEGKCCIIHDGLACASSLDCCEPKPFCIDGKCTSGCFGEESQCGESCCEAGKQCFGTVCCDPEYGCASANGGLGACCGSRFCCAPDGNPPCLCEFDGCCA